MKGVGNETKTQRGVKLGWYQCKDKGGHRNKLDVNYGGQPPPT